MDGLHIVHLDAAGEPDGDGEEVEAGRLQQDQLRTCARDCRLLEQGGTIISISFELSSPYFIEIYFLLIL